MLLALSTMSGSLPHDLISNSKELHQMILQLLQHFQIAGELQGRIHFRFQVVISVYICLDMHEEKSIIHFNYHRNYNFSSIIIIILEYIFIFSAIAERYWVFVLEPKDGRLLG